MAYEFIEMDDGHRYRLVQTGLFWNSKYNIYLDPDALGRLDISAEYKGKNFASRYKSSTEADHLAVLLRNMGIKKECLQNAKLPESAELKTRTEWSNLLAWILTSRNW